MFSVSLVNLMLLRMSLSQGKVKHRCYQFWIRILLDFQKVPDPTLTAYGTGTLSLRK
jgi:hypothetical protein